MLIKLSPRFILNTDSALIIEKNTKRSWQAADSEPVIDIFRDRMESWFFQPATEMIKSGNEVAAVHIVTPLIEALELRYQGMPDSNNQSGKFFKSRAKEIFGNRWRCTRSFIWRCALRVCTLWLCQE
jgi:hypothetical protein